MLLFVPIILFAGTAAAVLVLKKHRDVVALEASTTPAAEPDHAAVVGQSLATKPLDAGLSTDEQGAVRFALMHETNASHLTDFADTLTPSFPAASNLLRTKATFL